jgi:cysteinyl-tRNA synthetase
MLQLNGAKMSKSEGNYITPEQLFSGDSPLLSKAYSPMTLRYYFLQAHYASVLDMTDEGLLAAEKAYRKLMEANKILQSFTPDTLLYDGSESAYDRAILELIEEAYRGMDDDFNTAVALAQLNELSSYVYKIAHHHIPLNDVSPWVIERLKTVFAAFLFDIFGLKDETEAVHDESIVAGLMDLILELRAAARSQKDWATSDKIRDRLESLGIAVKDGREGSTWARL